MCVCLQCILREEKSKSRRKDEARDKHHGLTPTEKLPCVTPVVGQVIMAQVSCCLLKGFKVLKNF